MTIRAIVIAVCLTILTFVVIRTADFRKSVCSNLSCIRFRSQEQFTLKDNYADTLDTYRALYSSPTHTLRIEAKKIADDQSAAELMAAVTRINALFEKAPAPYPGEISDAIICDPNYIPLYKEATTSAGTHVSYFTGYLNDRLTFGSCSEDQAVNKGILAFMYCPKSSLLIKLELILPANTFDAASEETEKLLHSVACAK